MKKTIKQLTLFFCLLLLLWGCKPEPIDIYVIEHKPKLVVSSQIIPFQTMYVSLTKSFSLLNGNEPDQEFIDKITVKNAFVTVSYFNQTDTLTMVAPGVYNSNKILQYINGAYTLHARDSDTGDEITSTTTINPLVIFDSIVPKVSIVGPDTAITIKINFTDIPFVNNWYVINYYVKTLETQAPGIDINSYFQRGSNKLSEFQLLSDKEITNGRYSHVHKLNHVKRTDTIAVTLSNISEGYYKFLSTYLKSGNIVNQITGEPINYPTNIYNGYGYFSAHYPDFRIIELGKY